MRSIKSKFAAGARVARMGYGPDWYEDVVAKVYKSGNFTLVGDGKQPRQWRPWASTYDGRTEACLAKRDGWSRAKVLLLDEIGIKIVAEDRAKRARAEKVYSIRAEVERILRKPEDVSDDVIAAMCAAIELNRSLKAQPPKGDQ